MKEVFSHNRRLSMQALLVFFVLVFAVSGCSITLISSYDESTDKAVTQLQKDFETFFLTSQAGLPECGYENHKKFYQDSKVAISSIAVRAKAIPQNEITVEQVKLLEESLLSLEKLHQIKCFSTEQANNLRVSFNTSITAILKFELAKKRGE